MDTNEVRVKNEPIYDSQSIPQNKEASLSNSLPNRTQSNEAIRIKEEPIDIEMKTSKSQIESRSEEEVEIKTEEKFSATEEFINKTSIAFLNEETTSEWNKPRNRKTNNLQKSK